MAAPGSLNLEMTQGDDYVLTVTFTDADGGPFDVSGWSGVAAQVRRYPSADVVESFAVDSSDAANGVIALSLVAVQTVGLPPASVWDLERVEDGRRRTILAGRVFVRREVTRDE